MAIPLAKIKPWSLRPHDEALGFSTNQFLDWAQTALNALIGQSIQVGQGLDALSKSSVDPTTGRILSLGSRPQSLFTGITIITNAAAPQLTFYWDGTNGSVPLKGWRDDGTIVGPTIVGSGLAVSGLVAGTYFAFPYYDESTGRVVFPSVPGAVGSPPIVYSSIVGLALQQQLLRNHIPLSPTFGTTGIVVPASGSGSSGGGTGGGGGGGGHFGGGNPN